MPQRTAEQVVARARRILRAAIRSARTRAGRDRVGEIALHVHGYTEPGYSGDVIVTGNFNGIGRWEEVPMKWVEKDTTPQRVAELLGRAGVEVEWCDEWIACDWCHRLVRTQPDSYSWKPSYWRHPLGTYCHDCVRADPAEYLKHLEGRDSSAETIGLDLDQYGYVLVQDGYEHGLHHGQNADPKLVADVLRGQGISRFVFKLDSTSQFDCTFSVYAHGSEIAKLDRDRFEAGITDGPSVAEGLRRALADTDVKMAALTSGTIKVATCDVSSGTAAVRSITPDEFESGRNENVGGAE